MKQIDFKLETIRKDNFVKLSVQSFLWPENWDELSDKQMLAIGHVYSKSIPEISAKIELFFAVADIPKWWVKKFMKPDEINAFIVEGLVDPFLQDKNLQKGILKNAFKGFEGPDDRLKNLVWGQFCLAQAFMAAYERTSKPEFLDTLCAILFHKGSFDAKKADTYLKYWQKKPLGDKVAVYMTYVYQSSVLPTLYPKLYKKPDTSTTDASAPSKPVDYKQITINLAGGPFGTREELDREPAHNVLKYLDMNVQSEKKKK